MQIVIDEKGTAMVESFTESKGIQYDQKYMLARESEDDQRKYLFECDRLTFI